MMLSVESDAVLLLQQKGDRDVSNFDSQFTGDSVTRTPTDKLLLMNVDTEQFADFSYVNPEFIVVV